MFYMYKYAIKHHFRDRAIKSRCADACLSSVFQRTATGHHIPENHGTTRDLPYTYEGQFCTQPTQGYATLIEQFLRKCHLGHH